MTIEKFAKKTYEISKVQRNEQWFVLRRTLPKFSNLKNMRILKHLKAPYSFNNIPA